MKKICYVVTIPLTIRVFFVEQLQYLALNGWDVTVICSFDKELSDILGSDIHYIPVGMSRGLSLINIIHSIKELLRIFRDEQFNIVQYSTPNAAFASSIASWLSGIKVRNYHQMGLRFEGSDGFFRILLKMMEKITCILSTHIECVSPSGLKAALKYGLFPAKKGVVIWNGSSGGVNLQRFNIDCKNRWRSEIRRSFKLSEETLVIGFVGRVTKDKGINELLEAFRIISTNQINISLLIIGDLEVNHGLDFNLLSWAKRNNSIKWKTHVLDIEKYYSCLDVLVLPSHREGFGNVIIEASAMGVPVLVSNIPGPRDAMVERITGLVFDVKNVDSLILKIEEMYDSDFRNNCSSNAVKYVVNNFDSRVLCEKILERKEKLLENRKYE